MIVRDVRLEDAAAIAEINREALGYEFPLESTGPTGADHHPGDLTPAPASWCGEAVVAGG
ncbi:hypothetical protein GCM10022267_53280 [Lentzea roselyniae]|uniref:GNAT family N-acetyltransferase n=1 Tax=Lentzea roselyniae TaxID=531940 RepID=A0ABP7BIT0_9PSEU|nr:hypothetical protein [Lentzea atacamensis]